MDRKTAHPGQLYYQVLDSHSYTGHPILDYGQICQRSVLCLFRWVTGEWWPCSQTKCGTGFQERLVQCRVLEANGRDRVAPYELCDAATRPADERECVVRDSSGCDTSWEVEEWGEVRSEE